MENLTGRIHSFETLGAVDGPGIRFVLFMQGCPLRCKYCHNRDTWDLKGGTEYTVDEIFNKIIRYKNYFITSNGGVTVSGGEPLLQKDITEFIRKIKSLGLKVKLDTNGTNPDLILSLITSAFIILFLIILK